MKATATRPAPALDDERPREPQPTRIAVFGSVAAERPLDGGEPGTPAPVRAVLERVLESIAGRAPAIAEPILDRAVADGRITRFERHALLRELGHPDGVGGGAAASVPARQVLREVLAAVRRAAPTRPRPAAHQPRWCARTAPGSQWGGGHVPGRMSFRRSSCCYAEIQDEFSH